MFTLPQLAFSKESLHPILSAEGIDYHYGKHHKTYVNNLNNLIKNTAYENLSLTDIIIASRNNNEIAIYNNAAQHYNHSFFWNCLAQENTTNVGVKTRQLIEEKYNTLADFKVAFNHAATKLFGSGWVWITLDEKNQLEITTLKDADTPIAFGLTPLLTIDVWEHAYYIDHRNARINFILGFWSIINWDFVEKNIQKHLAK